MNGLEILNSCRDQLAAEIAAYQQPACVPLPISVWVASALLQKAIRRGCDDLALGAAATLLRDSPDRFWRRACAISFEDVGVGDLKTVGLVTAAVARKAWRTELGGEWRVASFIVRALANATKSRTSDDLLMVCERHPALVRQRRDFAHLPVRALLQIAASSEGVVETGLAVWMAIGTNRCPSAHLPTRSGEPETVFEWLCESCPHSQVEIARVGFRRGAGILAPLTALVSGEPLPNVPFVSQDELLPEVLLGGIPGWAFDVFSREGRSALGQFLHEQTPTADWVRSHIAPAKRIRFLGELVFRVEGGLLDKRLRWPLGDRLRSLYETECLGLDQDTAMGVVRLMGADLPALNQVRINLFGGCHNVR